jgi:uncharacterized coiled-coil protein SlyX
MGNSLEDEENNAVNEIYRPTVRRRITPRVNNILFRFNLLKFIYDFLNEIHKKWEKKVEDKQKFKITKYDDLKENFEYSHPVLFKTFDEIEVPHIDTEWNIRGGDNEEEQTDKGILSRAPVRLNKSAPLIKVRNDFRTLRDSHIRLENSHERLKKSYKDVKASNEDLKNKFNEFAANQELDRQSFKKEMMDMFNVQKQELEQKIAHQDKQIAHQDNQIVTLNATVLKQNQEIDWLHQKIANQDKQIATLNATVLNQEQEIIGLKKENAGLKEELANSEHTITALKDNKKTLVKNLREANKNNENLERENRSLIMAQNPSLSKERYEFYKGFKLVLMSELPKDQNPMKGKMYIGKRYDNKLEYVVRTHAGEIANGIIDVKVITELEEVILFILTGQILQLAIERNHIPPFPYRNTKNSPSREYNIFTGIRDTFSICIPGNRMSKERKEEEIRRCAYTNDIDGLGRALEGNKNLVNGRGIPDSFYSFSNKLHDKTALMLAVQEGNIKCVELLLKNGAETNLVDRNKYTALDYAQQNRHAEIESILIRHGAVGAVRIPELNHDNRVVLKLK